MFHGLVHDPADDDLAFDVVMEDIEALNERAEGRRPALDVTKVSVGTLGRILDRYALLGAGAALGRGCGPLVVRRAVGGPASLAELAGSRVAIPGKGTTAALLLRIFAPVPRETVELRFDQIMPAVARGDVDAGVIIHESRFTYADHGLVSLADLGQRWEDATGLPLPLGVIVGRRSLGADVLARVEARLRGSIERAWREPERVWPYVREHAQEMDADVCRRHIDLYVNGFSATMGTEGWSALETLLDRGRAVGWWPHADRPLRV